MVSIMDSTEAQLRYGSALSSAGDPGHPNHPLHASQNPTRRERMTAREEASLRTLEGRRYFYILHCCLVIVLKCHDLAKEHSWQHFPGVLFICFAYFVTYSIKTVSQFTFIHLSLLTPGIPTVLIGHWTSCSDHFKLMLTRGSSLTPPPYPAVLIFYTQSALLQCLKWLAFFLSARVGQVLHF